MRQFAVLQLMIPFSALFIWMNISTETLRPSESVKDYSLSTQQEPLFSAPDQHDYSFFQLRRNKGKRQKLNLYPLLQTSFFV